MLDPLLVGVYREINGNLFRGPCINVTINEEPQRTGRYPSANGASGCSTVVNYTRVFFFPEIAYLWVVLKASLKGTTHLLDPRWTHAHWSPTARRVVSCGRTG